MRILWLSHLVPYPPKGGVLQRSYNLLKEMCRYHDVTLFAFNQTALMESMFPNLAEGVREAKKHLSEFCKRVELFDIPSEAKKYGKYSLALKSLFSRYPYTINWLVSDKMTAAIKLEILKSNFDAIHFDTISLVSYLPLFGKTPKVLDHHNIESHMMLRRSKQEHNLGKKLYFYQEGIKLLKYEKKLCEDFNLHITCSELDSLRLKEICPEVYVDEIPNGVDIEYFVPHPEKERAKSLIFAGGLKWYPNKEAMVFFARDVWPLLKSSCPDVSMDVIGNKPPKELVELAAYDSNYHVHGFVDDVRTYLSQASIYVCPIRDGGGTKLKILDAFASGKAVVAHPIACEGIDVTENENVFFAETAEEFANKILYLMENENIRKSLGEKARQLVVKKYSFSEIGRKLSKDFENLTERNF